jgi:hypothetical protein
LAGGRVSARNPPAFSFPKLLVLITAVKLGFNKPNGKTILLGVARFRPLTSTA